jgi:hypothetical protein
LIFGPISRKEFLPGKNLPVPEKLPIFATLRTQPEGKTKEITKTDPLASLTGARRMKY